MNNDTIKALKEAATWWTRNHSSPQRAVQILNDHAANILTLITQLEQAEGVDLEKGAAALLNLEICDGFDRNGSHSSGTYQEYKWSLRQYLRPQDEWKAGLLARACYEANNILVKE